MIIVFLLYSIILLIFVSNSFLKWCKSFFSLVEILFPWHSINVTLPSSIYNQVEGIQSLLIWHTGIDWRPQGKKKNSISFFLQEFLQAPEGLYNNLARPQIALFTTSVIIGGHKHEVFFFLRERELCSVCWLIRITKSLEKSPGTDKVYQSPLRRKEGKHVDLTSKCFLF